MPDKNNDGQEPRRRLLRTVAAGGSALSLTALPGKWAKPVVASVILPAHAQTSPGCLGTLANCPSGDLYSDSGSFGTTKYIPPFITSEFPGITYENGTLTGSDRTRKYTSYGTCPAPCDDLDANKYASARLRFGYNTGSMEVNVEYRCGDDPVADLTLAFSGVNQGTIAGSYTGTFSYDVEACKYLYGGGTGSPTALGELGRQRRSWRDFDFGSLLRGR